MSEKIQEVVGEFVTVLVFKNLKGVVCVRVRDTETQENIGIKPFKDVNAALVYAEKCLA